MIPTINENARYNNTYYDFMEDKGYEKKNVRERKKMKKIR